jgi:ribosomal peptide maturation radical SAM protein 1
MDIVFPVMPFADVGRPAIGVSLLQAAAQRVGVSSRILYFNLDFAARAGIGTYQRIASGFPPDSLIGEWFFADILFGDRIPDADRFVIDILGQYGADPSQLFDIFEARNHRDAFLAVCAARIAELRPQIVGFSTTFHQSCACIALAKRLKEMNNPPTIVFGGANCEGEMGAQLLRSFDCIDFVSTGEADLSFPTFLCAVIETGRPIPVPGILGRDQPAATEAPALVAEMDALPIPAYDDYFEAYARSPLRSEIKPELLMETSRGCWWGAKHHCTFCGLNGETMAFRRKSEGRVFDEMRTLSETFGLKRIECVDNILDVRYLSTLFPRLAASGLGLELFYEVKANLKRDQLAALKAGGMRSIQPGIESFSTEVLKLMRKGCTGLQNIQLLRWCEELELGVAWNLLAGFPGEDPGEYDRMAAFLPLLVHLPAPASCSSFRLDRFSPFYMDAKVLGLRRVRPTHAYFYVYPFGRRDLSRLAYYFEFDYVDGRDPHAYTNQVSREVGLWVSAQGAEKTEPRRLDARWIGGGFDIVDTRASASRADVRLDGLAAELYLACDSAQRLEVLAAAFANRVSAMGIEDILTGFVRDGLVLELDGQYLSLAVMRQRPKSTPTRKGMRHEAALAEPLQPAL